jgi:uncharacterized protein (TIGR01244 family)
MPVTCTDYAEHAAAARERGMAAYAVTPTLVLAGQPQPEDWAHLARDGFATVINIRSDAARAALERRNVEAAGLSYHYLPLPAYELEPEHLAQFHDLMQAQEGKLLLHCRSATRVALLWMLERMVYRGWTLEQAEAQLRAAGYGDDAIEALDYCACDYRERTEDRSFPL